ncbi:MAG: hypothetical protein EOM22_00225 [Gammaproteobacteria bacterium]|nr:hypothetical protein [Gammaproteobacteria bacterium]
MGAPTRPLPEYAEQTHPWARDRDSQARRGVVLDATCAEPGHYEVYVKDRLRRQAMMEIEDER